MRIKVFLDTNVLLDMLVTSRDPQKNAQSIITAVKKCLLDAQVSTQSIIDVCYSARRQKLEDSIFMSFLKDIRRYVNISPIYATDLDWAMENYSGDFEDDAQYACAYDGCCDFFITNDKELLKRNGTSPMVVMSPGDFVAKMRQ